ncbi:MAG: response regulator, partial [Desulfobacteraceae bacterium]|nr:response regulator [Desulfobacteraceae bacterium]
MINSKFNNTGRTLKKTILIIDDEIYIRKSTRSFLEDYGFAVIEAEDGQVGLERCKKDKPDLV